MTPLYFLMALAILSMSPTSYGLPVALWLLNYTQPFALEYFKYWLSNRRK